MGPGVLDGEHAAIPGQMDADEGARLAAAGRHDPAALQSMQGGLGRTSSTAAPSRNLQDGIAVRTESDLEELADETSHQWSGLAPRPL